MPGPPRDTRSDVQLGALIAACGVALVVWPGATIRVLAALLGVAAIVHGIRELVTLFAGRGERLGVAAGMLALVALFGGFVVLITPFVSEDATRVVIGVFWVVFGVAEIAAAVPGGLDPARLAIGGSALVVGIIVLVVSSLALAVLVWLTGAWMFVSGVAVAIGAAAAPRSVGPPGAGRAGAV